ncbi:FAD binding oxidoreductase [Penicillium macrosclerotiorum]|uniref:FAD binding oxidoreductase n=1 Tax=Penicillium macrosclerotiorum TaxID=303699 RepID=UPI0025474C5D|nr:FAD binding oxidoreductase [Penicillium macrosclerotiorum]KAJ5676221.1 FAD binding oxidoreductase [Penicillium macrosclerotiorum]
MGSIFSVLFSSRRTSKTQAIVWRGQVDPAVYEKARTRRLFNAQKPKRYPLAIAFARSQSDIVDAVKLAIQRNCRISVRAGGHSYAGWSVRDESILLDLGSLSDGPILDELTGIVSVSPSMTGKDLVSYLSTKGRTISAGHCPDVGLGGFLLGGGMGWNCNNWGWACEQIKAVDVVTADAQLVRADSRRNTDLFWAARGAGPAFPGIVTRFHLQTRVSSFQMWSSAYVYPLRHYKAAFNWALKIPSSVQGGLEVVAIGSYQQESTEPCITIAIIVYGDQKEKLYRILQQLDETHPDGTLFRSFCEVTSFQQEFERKAQAFPAGHRYFVENAWLKNDIDVATVLEPAFTKLPSRKSLALWQSMAPCSRRELPEMALSMQSDHYLALYGIWEHEKDDFRCQSAISSIIADIEADTVGAYLGELDFRARQTKYWGDNQRRKLIDIRKKWDPNSRICGCLGLDELDKSEISKPRL